MIFIWKKIDSEWELLRISTVININLIEEIHKSSLHQGKLKALDKIKELKIYYKGNNNNIEEIYYLHPVCLQKKVVFYKRNPSKQIIMSKTIERLIMDLAYNK